MRQWYYTQEGQQCGPISEPEFVTLFETGQLAPDTMVWSEGLEQWATARDVDELIPTAFKPPPLPPLPPLRPTVSAPPDMRCVPSGEQHRPWVRFWGRMVDFFLFSSLARIVLTLIYAPALEIPDALFGIILLFAYAFVESAMLAAWGTTPGKAILKIRLRNGEGSKLSYADALSRAFKVWFRGEGMGIPIVTLITQISAYIRLTRQGITSWDEEGSFKVTHRTIGPWRTTIVVLIMLGMFILMAIETADL